MKILADYSLEELKKLLADYGEKPFRALQLYEGLHSGKELSEISNIPKSLADKLAAEGFAGLGVTIREKLTSKDGTVKYLYELNDGNIIEGVFMRYKYGNTLCVSTQVGCRMNCAFCASGLDGLIRNLSAGEMLAEVLLANADNGGNLKTRAITNVVLMGSGEPFDNYDNTARFLRLLNSGEGLNIGIRNISLSTCGLLEGVDKLIEDKLYVTLTFSLHASNDIIREKLMPINKAYGIDKIISAAKRYFEATGRRVIFEYSLIRGVNDSLIHAKELAARVKGFPSHINLIVLNYVKEKGLKGADSATTKAFLECLTDEGISATIRRTMGEDIDGACGQLRRSYLGK
ncbi:MAG: 23S rRNA (adenine(2503)-C(2))-methyltransferase RlmN [Clostridia bacterium]|nr:23S rRNA (adenine(2503)-C(2))-methyltransferase RlmN [Clostridia bacterium]